MTLGRDIKRRQRAWAARRGIAVDRNGYVDDVGGNFLRPLSPRFEAALAAAGGGELREQRDRPAKIRALHSSAVLAINVFQHWEGRIGVELPTALGFDGKLVDVRIEAQFDTHLRGRPPTLDVALGLDDGRLVAIESKFTEWMSSKRPKLDDFRHKYLPPTHDFWTDAGLPSCQSLAADIGLGTTRFRQLDALQLLKHALGLATSAAQPFVLVYLYFDVEGPAEIAARHRAEIGRFADRIDAHLGFRAITYQDLLAALATAPEIDPAYVDDLRQRYFAGRDRP